MAHFTVLVILPPDTIDIQEKVRELLHPYDSELDVQPYKQYLNQKDFQAEIKNLSSLSKDEIDQFAIKYELSGENIIENLAKINLYWYEEDVAGVDEYGEYQITTYNPQSKWDWYRFIKAKPRESETPISYPCKVKEIFACYSEFIVVALNCHI